jgi:hypothetical protein
MLCAWLTVDASVNAAAPEAVLDIPAMQLQLSLSLICLHHVQLFAAVNNSTCPSVHFKCY